MKNSEKEALKGAFNIPEPKRKDEFLAQYGDLLEKKQSKPKPVIIARYAATAAAAALVIAVCGKLALSPNFSDPFTQIDNNTTTTAATEAVTEAEKPSESPTEAPSEPDVNEAVTTAAETAEHTEYVTTAAEGKKTKTPAAKTTAKAPVRVTSPATKKPSGGGASNTTKQPSYNNTSQTTKRTASTTATVTSKKTTDIPDNDIPKTTKVTTAYHGPNPGYTTTRRTVRTTTAQPPRTTTIRRPVTTVKTTENGTNFFPTTTGASGYPPTDDPPKPIGTSPAGVDPIVPPERDHDYTVTPYFTYEKTEVSGDLADYVIFEGPTEEYGNINELLDKSDVVVVAEIVDKYYTEAHYMPYTQLDVKISSMAKNRDFVWDDIISIYVPCGYVPTDVAQDQYFIDEPLQPDSCLAREQWLEESLEIGKSYIFFLKDGGNDVPCGAYELTTEYDDSIFRNDLMRFYSMRENEFSFNYWDLL